MSLAEPVAPWDGYDEQTAEEIAEHLKDVAPDTAAAVRTYEAANKSRSSVMKAVATVEAGVTYDDSTYRPEQLIQNASVLVGQPAYIVETALRTLAPEKDFLTSDEARQLCADFLKIPVEEG
jgi:hypothetical protein